MLNTLPQTVSATLAALAAWVVKDGVALGGLSPGLREQALAVAWSGLPENVMNEKAVNAALQAQLAGAARFLDTDHVELRRWLVDGGWLTRDGFGREYRRVPLQGLADSARPVAAALQSLDVAAWVGGVRAQLAGARDARRQAWELSRQSLRPMQPPQPTQPGSPA